MTTNQPYHVNHNNLLLIITVRKTILHNINNFCRMETQSPTNSQRFSLIARFQQLPKMPTGLLAQKAFGLGSFIFLTHNRQSLKDQWKIFSYFRSICTKCIRHAKDGFLRGKENSWFISTYLLEQIFKKLTAITKTT